jgi:uncharacterized protein YndB with AHSA1/START domain
VKDLLSELELTSRQVGVGTVPAGDARVVALTRRYEADLDDVWDALTSAERIPRWFLPIHGDLRVGGRFQFEGQAGGEIRECEPPRRFVVTWEMGGPADASFVEVALAAVDGGAATELTLTHTAVFGDEFWDQYGPGAVGVGWDLAMIGMTAWYAGVELGTPEEQATNPEIRAALTASSDAWRVANVAGGESEADAARMAAATTAFYVP